MDPGVALRACAICMRGDEAAVEVLEGAVADASDPPSEFSLSLSEEANDGRYRITPEK